MTLFGRYPQKLAIAAQQGVQTIFRSGNGSDEISAVQTKKFDLVVEATGSPGAINEAIHLVRPEGAVVIKTTSLEKSEIDLATVVVNELRLMGSRCGDIGQALDFLERKVIDLRPMVEAVYPLGDFEKAFAHAGGKGSLKILNGNKNYEKGQK